MEELTFVRENMMNDKNYRSYCGGNCSGLTRVDDNFTCPKCGWKAKFDVDFMKRYLSKHKE